MKDPELVSGVPCAYRLGSILPWPPQLPHIDNWAKGDLPTLCAYIYALGERLAQAEEKIDRLEHRLGALDARTVGLVKF